MQHVLHKWRAFGCPVLVIGIVSKYAHCIFSLNLSWNASVLHEYITSL
jgi:hypothetical protein